MVPLILVILFITLGMFFLGYFLIEKLKGYCLKETLIKSVASLFFIAVATVSLIAKSSTNLPLFVLFGLICGLVGDVLLELKYVKRDYERHFTYAGFVAFMVGHIFYMSGLMMEFYHGESFLYIILPIIIGILMSVGNLVLEKPMKFNFGEYRLVVFIYGCFLFSCAALVVSLNILNGFSSTTLFVLLGAGVFFVISDVILSGTYFAVGKDRPIDLILNAVTYYVAQYLIAFSLFFL